MRLEKFEQSNQEPIGEGDDKLTYKNPENNGRVISVLKEKEGVERLVDHNRG